MSVTVEVAKEDLQEMLDTLDASRREMTGTARLLGKQHEAIVGLRNALILIEDGLLPGDPLRAIADTAINLWGGL